MASGCYQSAGDHGMGREEYMRMLCRDGKGRDFSRPNPRVTEGESTKTPEPVGDRREDEDYDSLPMIYF